MTEPQTHTWCSTELQYNYYTQLALITSRTSSARRPVIRVWHLKKHKTRSEQCHHNSITFMFRKWTSDRWLKNRDRLVDAFYNSLQVTPSQMISMSHSWRASAGESQSLFESHMKRAVLWLQGSCFCSTVPFNKDIWWEKMTVGK